MSSNFIQMVLTTFSSDDVNKLFTDQLYKIKNEINTLPEDSLLNIGEQQYCLEITESNQFDFPIIYVDNVQLERTDTSFIFNVPYSGDISLLKWKPTTHTTRIGGTIMCVPNIIKFDVRINQEDAAIIKKEFQEKLNRILIDYEYLRNDFNLFHQTLLSKVVDLFNQRKSTILKRRSLEVELGIPLIKKESSNTFSVPRPKLRTPITLSLKDNQLPFSPEPTLNNETYFQILKIINDVGKNFERMPSTYAGKNEEDLRDHILLTVDPNFAFGSASGETFNKGGKTDILLKYDSSVIFIAECKYWSGIKNTFQAIDQLLKYLTWRNSKTALILFVKNHSITQVIQNLKESIVTHPNYVSNSPDTDINWFNYIFSLPEDRNKEIKISILLYHLP